MEPDNLELTLKVKPIVDEATERYMGAYVPKLSDDITSRLSRTSIFEFDVDPTIPYRAAKRAFKKAFITRLLLFSLGNISEVARITGKDRRSIHRMVIQFGINVRKIKRDLIRPYEIKLSTINTLIEDVLDKHRETLDGPGLREFYRHVPDLSDNILKEIPEPRISLREAQREFDMIYFRKALDANGSSISRTARVIGIRYETLSRKLRGLGLL
jgi:DNA-binding NtrC family response regulator